MSEIGQRIAWAMDRAGMNQSDLARVLDVSRNAVSQWTTGKTEPAATKLRQASIALRVNHQWLATGEGDAESDAPQGAAPISCGGAVLDVDVRAGAGGGGIPIEAWGHDSHGNPIPAEGVRDEWCLPPTIMREILHAAPRHIRAFEVIGDSMEPRLFEGDRVFVDMRYTVPSPEGIFALWDGQGVVIKRVQSVRGADPPRLRIISVNASYEPYEVLIEEIRIIGRYAGRFTTA